MEKNEKTGLEKIKEALAELKTLRGWKIVLFAVLFVLFAIGAGLCGLATWIEGHGKKAGDTPVGKVLMFVSNVIGFFGFLLAFPYFWALMKVARR